jgi:hypothetical protein
MRVCCPRRPPDRDDGGGAADGGSEHEIESECGALVLWVND